MPFPFYSPAQFSEENGATTLQRITARTPRAAALKKKEEDDAA